MIDDMIVADAVVHGYNWTPENFAVPESAAGAQGGYGFHTLVTHDDHTRLSSDEFLRDWTVDDIEEAVFLESPVDLVAYHGTPIWDLFHDGHSATAKGVELKRRNPGRTILYGAANPFHGPAALDEIDRLVDEDGIDALKVYAARYDKGKTLAQPLDDPEFGFPFIEKALERGINVIATHKAMPFGPVRPEPYGPSDIPEAAATYPEMNFEIVHAGFAFLEETALIAGAHPNVWLNLEASGGLILNAPRRFAEFLGTLLSMGAEDRILFATGCVLAHPRPLVQAFLDFEMPRDLVTDYGMPDFTAEGKRKVLGENLLRLHGIDADDLRARVADDDWARRRRELGEVPEWTHLRRRLAGDGA